MLRTSDVFTPAKLPEFTDVDREIVSRNLAKFARRGGHFISVVGTTKLGKTTLVKAFFRQLSKEDAWSVYLPGQSLREGASALWERLAIELEIPTSRETGLASSDRTTWGVFGSLKTTFFPGSGGEAGVKAGGEREHGVTNSQTFNMNPEVAVKQAISELQKEGCAVFIAIDDFHFITDGKKRREIMLSLRPLTDNGATVILSTIPGGQNDGAMAGTNLGGRHKSVEVPLWTIEELSEIARKGFAKLSLECKENIIQKLAVESFGSPQIMQSVCLEFCEDVNNFLGKGEGEAPVALVEPADWGQFFRDLEDDEAIGWLKGLTRGPNPKKLRKKWVHPHYPGKELDGYQLILLALNEMGAPREVEITDIKEHIRSKLDLTKTQVSHLGIELKAKNLSLIGSKETDSAISRQAVNDVSVTEILEDHEEDERSWKELEAADFIPQPVLEAQGQGHDLIVRILDPLLCFNIKWHPEVILESGR